MYRFVLGASLSLASLLAVAVAPAYAADPIPHRIIFAVDACDSTTFNAAVGPGACVGRSGVPFNVFVKQVETLHQAPAWRFAPGIVVATTTDPIQVQNIGGEVHTFTEVAKFGGGFVPLLNQLGGFGPMVPECGEPPNPDNHFLSPGEAFTFTEADPGTHLYQCCIHPWMHAALTIRP
ncbi:MAG: hypothetical protein JOY61_23330 [Chloroflexi bacterium]|nr:hypothetical protein [Chloroflexota bacterium]